MLDLLKAVFKYQQRRSPDKLGLYPEVVHTNAIPERRYLWTSRLLVIFASLSICLNIMLSSTLYVMLPQRGAQPRILIKDDYSNQLRLLNKQEVVSSPKDLLSENLIREYIKTRHTVPSKYDDLKKKWRVGSDFYWMSSGEVYEEFASEDIEQLLHSYQTSGFTREVNIEWVRPVASGLWVVRFATLDYYSHSKIPLVNIWHAYVRSVMALVNYDNKSLRYHNPYGFYVIGYSLSYIGSPDNVDNYMTEAFNRRLTRHY